MRLPKLKELEYIITIILIILGIVYDLYPSLFPTYNTFIFAAIGFFTWFAWKHASTLSKIETLLKREKFFIDRIKLPPLKERIEKAKKSIWILAQSGNTLIHSNYGLLERCCERGCEIKILLLDPKVVKDKMMSIFDKSSLIDSLKISINIIKEHEWNGRLLPFEPGFGLFIIDGYETEGEIKVELMLKSTKVALEWPNVIITKKEGETYNRLINHFNELWELSDPI